MFVFTYKFTEQFSSWVLVTITAERLVVVVWPLKSHLIVTPNRIVGILIITAIFLFGVNVHTLWTVQARQLGFCFYKESFVHSMYFDIYTWIDQLLHFIVPFIIISLFNACVIWKTYKRQQQSMVSAASHIKRETIITLFGLSLAFITLTSPLGIYMYFIIFSIFTKSWKINSKAFMICAFVQEFNLGINFYLYCLASSKFRAEVKRLCRCYTHNETHHRSSSSTGETRM